MIWQSFGKQGLSKDLENYSNCKHIFNYKTMGRTPYSTIDAYNHGFKNRTGPTGLTDSTADRSWFRFGLVNWAGNMLNRNQIGRTEGPISESDGSIIIIIFKIFIVIYTEGEEATAPNAPRH